MARRRRGWVALAVVALGVLIADAGVAWWLPAVVDRPLLALAIRARSPAVDRVAVAVSDIGSPTVMTVVAFGVVVVLVAVRRYRVAAGYAVAAAAGGELSPLLKAATDRARPPAADRLVAVSGSAFPSGHALGATVVLGLLLVVLFRHSHGDPGRLGDTRRRRVGGSALPAVAAAMVAAAVGASRVLLGVHWPTDVIAGWALGVAWVSLAALVGHALDAAHDAPRAAVGTGATRRPRGGRGSRGSGRSNERR